MTSCTMFYTRSSPLCPSFKSVPVGPSNTYWLCSGSCAIKTFYDYCLLSLSTGIYRQYLCEETKNSLKDVVGHFIEEMNEFSNCILTVTDSVYRNAIGSEQIKMSKYLARYAIELHDNEVFTPPRRRTYAILEASKTASCNAYIILISNALLTSQFLRYIEGERLVNTRGLFLLLEDHRLFRPDLRYIWRRIVNVVFLRRYGSYKRRSGEQIFREPIDLYTVEFPSRKKNTVPIKYINTWFDGKYRYGLKRFRRNATDLQRNRLRVAIFEHIPAVTKASRDYYDQVFNYSTNALGIEFELIRVMSKAMNFRAVYYMPHNIEIDRWGSRGENSVTGLFKEAVSGKAAFFLGDLHYTIGHLSVYDLSIPYNTECLTFLTPESLSENSWKLLILPFKLYTWMAVLFTLALGGSAIYLFSLSYKNNISLYKNKHYPPVTSTSNKKRFVEGMRGLYLFTEPQNSILYTYGMLLMVSLPRFPGPWAVRVFIGWWWIYSILVAVAYRCSMTATLADPVTKVTIDTLAELSKSSIAVGGWNEEAKHFFLMSPDATSQSIASKFEPTNNEDEAIERVANGTFAYYESSYLLQQAKVHRQMLEEMQLKNNSNAKEESIVSHRLHIMEECAVNIPVALGLEKNSPFKPQVDKWVRRMIEAGLVEKWLSDAMEWSKIAKLRQETESEKALVNLHKLHGALVALGIGYFLSSIALIVELVYWKYIVLKDPSYDKYYLDVFYKYAKRPKRTFINA